MDLMAEYLWVLACVASTFTLIAFCLLMVIVTRRLFWVGKNMVLSDRAEYRTRLMYDRQAKEIE